MALAPAVLSVLLDHLNAKLRPHADRPKAAVNIHHWPTASMDADIRGVDDDGVHVFFYSKIELVPWNTIERITLAHKDASGEYDGRVDVVYEAPEPEIKENV